MGQAHEQDKVTYKILLLGAGESGKSTLFKQVVKTFGDGFTEEQRVNVYIKIVHQNVMESVKKLLLRSPQYGPFDPSLEEAKKAVDDTKTEEEVTPQLAQLINKLWMDPGIQTTYAQRHLFQLNDSCKYFMDNVMRVCESEYIPTDMDIFMGRARTTGILHTDFRIDGVKFLMVDVGGQRNERKKWIHCFEGVNAVIFVASISEYDQMLFEDETVPRITEALKLFDEVCNSKWFIKTNIVLFLNKCDLFKEKIKLKPISQIFNDYTGDASYEGQANYLQKLFESRNKCPDGNTLGNVKKIYIHYTCATDSNNIRSAFTCVKDTIISNNEQLMNIAPGTDINLLNH